ncbi:MAG: type II toxin-antitoxin system RelE/ParE family toxin [Clostridiales bacterium]|jgi:phage-related protein|nr:type II toxin-antitoxin system RelE/ParE family toxin [Clostridiales bacterium]
MFDIRFYKDKDDNAPIAEYIAELDKKALTSKQERIRLKKIYEYFDILEQYGSRAGVPYVKHIDGDIWELRPTNDRIFYFFWNEGTYILLHHFIKDTQKTPQREIEQAKRNMGDFLERSDEYEQ